MADDDKNITEEISDELVIHFEADIRAVKRALRAVGTNLIQIVSCVKSLAERAEHGKTTLRYTTDLDPTAHAALINTIGKQASIEQEKLNKEDEEEEV